MVIVEKTKPCNCHQSDVTMSVMMFRITSLTIIQAQIKENIKAPRHWPSYRELTGHHGHFKIDVENKNLSSGPNPLK